MSDRHTWISAALIGLLVLAILFWFADPVQVFNQMADANTLLLAVVLIPFSLEALFTSLRVQHCVNHPVALRLATYCNAVYIAWLSILPVRLGELVGVAVFHKRLDMPLGSAIASVIVQRIYDVLILSGLLVVLLVQTVYGDDIGLFTAIGALIILIIVLLTLPASLGLTARALHTKRYYRWIKRLLYLLLQARTWYRHQSEPNAVFWLVSTTLGKWLVNISATVMIFTACGIELEFTMLATISILFHFLGAIPIQSFGGFGASEVGLVGILVSLGIPADQAVATSLMIRMMALVFVGLFFTVSFIFFRPRANS